MRLAAELADNACVFPSAPGADRAAVPRAVAEGLVQAAPRLALLTTMALLSYFCYTTQYLLWLTMSIPGWLYTTQYLLWLLTVQAALRLGSTDNVTVLVVWLVWEG